MRTKDFRAQHDAIRLGLADLTSYRLIQGRDDEALECLVAVVDLLQMHLEAEREHLYEPLLARGDDESRKAMARLREAEAFAASMGGFRDRWTAPGALAGRRDDFFRFLSKLDIALRRILEREERELFLPLRPARGGESVTA